MNLRKKTALLIIDGQKGFNDEGYWGGNRINHAIESNIAKLLETWRRLELPIFHIKHNSTNLNSPLHPSHPCSEIKNEVAPKYDEALIAKNVNSAFIGTDLKQQFGVFRSSTVIITGIQTDHCVSPTARIAAYMGFEPFVVSAATATFDREDMDGRAINSEIIQTIHLISLNDEFATIINTETIISQLDTYLN